MFNPGKKKISNQEKKNRQPGTCKIILLVYIIFTNSRIGRNLIIIGPSKGYTGFLDK